MTAFFFKFPSISFFFFCGSISFLLNCTQILAHLTNADNVKLNITVVCLSLVFVALSK
jgi:hypothetical protein